MHGSHQPLTLSLRLTASLLQEEENKVLVLVMMAFCVLLVVYTLYAVVPG